MTVCGVIFFCTLIGTVTVFFMKRKLDYRLVRIREERMAEKSRCFRFDFNEIDEAEENEIQTRRSRKKKGIGVRNNTDTI